MKKVACSLLAGFEPEIHEMLKIKGFLYIYGKLECKCYTFLDKTRCNCEKCNYSYSL
jgi:hypothetical protein